MTPRVALEREELALFVAETERQRMKAHHEGACRAPNEQLQRTVTRRRVRGASASGHCALAPRSKRHRASAELKRETADCAYPLPSPGYLKRLKRPATFGRAEDN